MEVKTQFKPGDIAFRSVGFLTLNATHHHHLIVQSVHILVVDDPEEPEVEYTVEDSESGESIRLPDNELYDVEEAQDKLRAEARRYMAEMIRDLYPGFTYRIVESEIEFKLPAKEKCEPK